MKILIVSLLRIGDVILSAPVLKGLRSRYPEAELHLLVNSQFVGVGSLMPYVDRLIPFEREKLQRGLGDPEVPVFESYERLADLIDDLNSAHYDWVINLTHNRLSGWLMSLLDVETKTGLAFDIQGRVGFGSRWFRYLNHQVDAEGREVFHFTDVFRFAIDAEGDSASGPLLVETGAGRREAEEFLETTDGHDVIAVQPLTSDEKKNWGLGNFAAAIASMSRRHPEALFAILGAPFERERLEPLVAELESKNVRVRLAILSFEGAFSLLRAAKLLLTGDTSVKHLACAAGTPVVELSLGSSDPFRTGAYRQGSVIVRSREFCAPCVHSRPCHRATRLCSEKMPAEAVAMIASEVYSGRLFQLRPVAEEYAETLEILRVENKVSGFWAAYSVVEPFTEKTVARWIDLACRKISLTGGADIENAKVVGIGTEILRLSRLLTTIHPAVSAIEWRHLLADFERQLQIVESRLNGFKIGLQHLKGCYEDPRKMREFSRGLLAFREHLRPHALLASFKNGLDQAIEDDVNPAFTRFRHMIDLVAEIEIRAEIQLRLIRGLAGVFNASTREQQGAEKI